MQPKKESKKLSIGVVGPFSGPRACYGQLLKEIIDQSGLSRHVHILWHDDQGVGTKAPPIAESLVNKGVLAVIGHFNSDSALQASPIYRQAQIPLLLPASTALSLANLELIFRICPNDQQQIMAIIKHLEENEFNHLAVWMDDSNYAQRLRDLLQQSTTISCENFRKGTQYECLLFLGAHHQVASFLLKQGQALQAKHIICCDDCAIEEFYADITHRFPNVWIATPYPCFSQCIQKAAELVGRYLTTSIHNDFHSWLKKEPLFLNNQNSHALFNLVHLKGRE